MFEFVTAFSGQSVADDYAWYLEQWLAAERRGFEGIFFSEHHFVPGRYSPSPNLFIAALATRTQRLRLGTMGNVVPLYEPWRLAEEFAVLDQLSRGRLEIGYASGSGPREHLAIGLSADEVRPRFDEALDVIDALLTSERITHQGRFWTLRDFGVAPRPLQIPAPRRWMTGLSLASAAVAARRGYGYCTGFIGAASVAAAFDAYRTAAGAASRAVTADRLALRRMVVIADDAGAARELGAQALQGMRALMGGAGRSDPGADSPAAQRGAVPDAPQGRHGGSLISDEEVIAGDVPAVMRQIIEQCGACGAGHFCAYPVNHLTRAQATRSLQLWQQVNAGLRAAGQAGAS
jgi:alkanesulfonate monooxygenase SsuD/methylene tetrahydromethanopterin reductase-like flavin-dependent oxidoreductase (luciferase family)